MKTIYLVFVLACVWLMSFELKAQDDLFDLFEDDEPTIDYALMPPLKPRGWFVASPSKVRQQAI